MRREAVLENVRRFRAIASLYRQTAAFRPDQSWSLLGQAKDWEYRRIGGVGDLLWRLRAANRRAIGDRYCRLSAARRKYYPSFGWQPSCSRRIARRGLGCP